MARFDSREAADAFVDALPAVTHRSLGAALQKRVQNAKVAHGEAFLKELRKRLSLDHGEERAVGWALVRRGLVERQSPPLWRVLADHIGAYPNCASVDDVVLLLSGISDPGEDLGGTIRSFPHWSASLDEICFVICGADLAVLRELWRASTGRARIGLTGLLYRGGVLSAQELAEDSDANDWAQLLGRHFRETPQPSALIWPTHPAATSREWRPAWYRCVELWDSVAGDWTAAFHDLIDRLSNRRAFAAAFSSVELATPAQPIGPLAAPKGHPGARSRKALKGQPAKVSPVEAPAYSEVLWVYGCRVRASGDQTELAQSVFLAAVRHELPSTQLFGAIQAANGELVLGAILNGAPIVRDVRESRENVIACVHAAVRANLRLGHGDLDSWRAQVDEVIRDVLVVHAGAVSPIDLPNSPLGGLELSEDATRREAGWHLVAKLPGPGGTLYWGTLLQNAGSSFEDERVHTVPCFDEEGAVVARVLGAQLLRVDAEHPVASVSAPLVLAGSAQETWQRDVERRLERLTGKARPCALWLVRGGTR